MEEKHARATSEPRVSWSEHSLRIMTDPTYLYLSRYTPSTLIVLGTFGALANQVLFNCRRSLRAASCSLYFRALSINDLMALYLFVLLQWLVDQFDIDPTLNYEWYCRMKAFLNSGFITLSPYLLVMACFDRLCTSSTNVRLRRIATVRVASHLILCTCIVVFASYFHMIIGYQLIKTPFYAVCAISTTSYTKFISVFTAIFMGLIPPILMITFSSATLFFVRRQRRLVMPINHLRIRQRDTQLLKMSLLYVICHLIVTMPFAVTLLLVVYQQANLPPSLYSLFRCFTLLLNVNFSTSFYIYTLGTPFYRYELVGLIISIRARMRRMIGRIQINQMPEVVGNNR